MSYTTISLSLPEARRHVETVQETMDLLTRVYPDTETALLYSRLQELRELLERGLSDEAVLPFRSLDTWQRPVVPPADHTICAHCELVVPLSETVENEADETVFRVCREGCLSPADQRAGEWEKEYYLRGRRPVIPAGGQVVPSSDPYL